MRSDRCGDAERERAYSFSASSANEGELDWKWDWDCACDEGPCAYVFDCVCVRPMVYESSFGSALRARGPAGRRGRSRARWAGEEEEDGTGDGLRIGADVGMEGGGVEGAAGAGVEEDDDDDDDDDDDIGSSIAAYFWVGAGRG